MLCVCTSRVSKIDMVIEYIDINIRCVIIYVYLHKYHITVLTDCPDWVKCRAVSQSEINWKEMHILMYIVYLLNYSSYIYIHTLHT